MPARRRKRRGRDVLYVTTEGGLPLGSLNLGSREVEDVPLGRRAEFYREANAWLWNHSMAALRPPEEPGRARADAVEVEDTSPQPWYDLATNWPGRQVTREASRRRATQGEGADRSFRVDADGELRMAEALEKLVTPPRLGPFRLRRPARWRVLHSVPVGVGSGDIGHLLIGPPGVFTINTRAHPGGKVQLTPDSVTIDGGATDYVDKARAEAVVAARLLSEAMDGEDVPVTPVLGLVGATLLGSEHPRDVIVSTPRGLPRLLQALSPVLVTAGVEAIYEVARRSTTWLRG